MTLNSQLRRLSRCDNDEEDESREWLIVEGRNERKSNQTKDPAKFRSSDSMQETKRWVVVEGLRKDDGVLGAWNFGRLSS
jgi:hypothetical protein